MEEKTNDRDDVRRAIHLVAAARDAKRYAEWIIADADAALARLAEDGIYPEDATAGERVNPVKDHVECNYPTEKIERIVRDQERSFHLTAAHMTDAERFAPQEVWH